MNEIIAGSILSTTDALYCIHDNTWCDCIRCFDQDVVFSTGNANTVEKQAKYEQEEWKPSFQPALQLKKPGFSFVPTAATMDMMFWEIGHVKIINKLTCHSALLNGQV